MARRIDPSRNITETALMRLLAARRELQSATEDDRGIWSTRILHSDMAPAQNSVEMSILRSLSIVEVYVDALAVELKESIDLGATPKVAAIIDRHVTKQLSAWASRKDLYNQLFGIPLGGLPSWPKLRIFIEVRNSIAHGLGQLTIQQRTNVPQTQDDLKTIGIQIVDGKLDMDPSVAIAALAVCRSFVIELDVAANVR